jgi:hypothetical protein
MWHAFALQSGQFSDRMLGAWQYGIERCQSITTNFCKQYRLILWNVPCVTLQYLINEVLGNETILLSQKIHNSETMGSEKLSVLISRPGRSTNPFWELLVQTQPTSFRTNRP